MEDKDGGDSDVDVWTFCCKILKIFSKIMVYLHKHGGWASADIYDKWRVFFV